MRASFASSLFALLAIAARSASAFNYSTITEHCADIYHFTGDAGLEASTEVTDVTYIGASGATPAYCSVVMTIEKYTGVLM